MKGLVLSLFPGIGLLDMAFEEAGFCVVRGPDLLWGGDIRKFHPPAGRFDGVIGGPPCQSHSPLVWLNRHQGVEPKHPDMTPEFARCVNEVAPEWFVMENSPFVPTPEVAGFIVDRCRLNNRHLGEAQNRDRVFCFGTRTGARLHVATAALQCFDHEPAVLASELTKGKPLGTRQRSPRKRSLPEIAVLQGLPADFLSEAPFTVEGKCRVIGNGVPLAMGRAVAAAVIKATREPKGRHMNRIILPIAYLVFILGMVALASFSEAGAQTLSRDQQHRATHDFWINHGSYTSPADGSHCCGDNDCKMIPAEDMSALPGGWNINTTGELIPYSEAQSSEDGQFWRCKRYDGSRRCFFAPQPSS